MLGLPVLSAEPVNLLVTVPVAVTEWAWSLDATDVAVVPVAPIVAAVPVNLLVTVPVAVTECLWSLEATDVPVVLVATAL